MSTVVNLTVNLDGVLLPDPKSILESLTEEHRFEIAKQLIDKFVFGNAITENVEAQVVAKYGANYSSTNTSWEARQFKDKLLSEYVAVRKELIELSKKTITDSFTKVLEEQKEGVTEEVRQEMIKMIPGLLNSMMTNMLVAMIQSPVAITGLLNTTPLLHTAHFDLVNNLRNRGIQI